MTRLFFFDKIIMRSYMLKKKYFLIISKIDKLEIIKKGSLDNSTTEKCLITKNINFYKKYDTLNFFLKIEIKRMSTTK